MAEGIKLRNGHTHTFTLSHYLNLKFLSSFFFLFRLFGLKDIISPFNCSSHTDDLMFNTKHDWPVYVNPGILFLLYITVVTILKINSHGYQEKVLTRVFLIIFIIGIKFQPAFLLSTWCLLVYNAIYLFFPPQNDVLGEAVELMPWGAGQITPGDDTKVGPHTHSARPTHLTQSFYLH